MIKRLPVSFLLILCMSFLIGKGVSFCQEEMEEKKEVLIIPFGIEINKNLLPSYEMNKEGISAIFDPYMRYTEKRVGVRYKEKVLTTEEMVTCIRKKEIKSAFLAAGTYIKAHKEFGFVPLVKPVIGTSETFKYIILVRKDSGIKTVEELKGKRFICSGLKSWDDYLFVWALLSKKKGVKDLNDFFGKIIIPKVYKENSIILAILLKEADVACVSDYAFSVTCKLNPRIGEELLILAQSEPISFGPKAYSPDFIDEYGEECLLKMKKELLHMHQTPEGDQFLLTFKVKRFVEARDSDYDSLRQMVKDIGIEIDELFH